MKYVILIHSNPQPWGHPTSIFTDEGRAVPQDQTDAMDRDFDALLTELSQSKELVHAEALGAPADSKVYRWESMDSHPTTDGPYAEAKEQLAGFFVIDCASAERAEQIADQFAQPGGTIELRPTM